MGLKLFKWTDFYFNFYEKRMVPPIYLSIYLENQTNPIYAHGLNNTPQNEGPIFISLFPTYLSFRIADSCTFLQLKKIFRVKGFAIAIENCDSAENYINAHFKPNFRTSLRRRQNGLETCFNIRYKMFYGSIAKDEYDTLMESLHYMLVRRFDQRNDDNMALGKWDDYYNNTFSMINDKNASLFVIYNDVNPIQIALNFHIGKVLFLSVPSYDIDYAKFGLGNIAIKKLLEWCMDNEYEMLDMGYGDFDYKLKWCNKIYDFEHHLFYNKSSPMSRFKVALIKLNTQLINYLLEKKINILYRRVKDVLLRKKGVYFTEFTFEKVKPSIEELQQSKQINPFVDDSYAFLRRALYDFLYINLEHLSNIEVYELKNNKAFYFKGNKQMQKVIIQN